MSLAFRSALSRPHQLARSPASKAPSSRRPRQRCAAVAGPVKVDKFPRWQDIWKYLISKKLESLPPADANMLVNSGDWVIVDVRPKPSYEKAHISGAVSCPLYQPLDMTNAGVEKYLKLAMYTFNGVSPIEMNPTFSEEVAKAAASGKGLILYCEAGGTMTPSPNFEFGKASRSLQAAFRTIREDINDKVKHLDGGIYAWYQSGLPIDGEYDTSDVGRTPNAAAIPTGLSTTPGDK